MELVDATDLKSVTRKGVRVRVPPQVHNRSDKVADTLDEKVQYILACAVANGIKYKIAESEHDTFCEELVSFFNDNVEAMLEMKGDKDGILVLDYSDEPILSVFPKTDGMKFIVFDLDRSLDIFKTVVQTIEFLRMYFMNRHDDFEIVREKIGVTFLKNSVETRKFADEGFTIV